MRRPTGKNGPARQRKVAFTDDEWDRIRRNADREGVSCSRYVAGRTLARGAVATPDSALFDLVAAHGVAAKALACLAINAAQSGGYVDGLRLLDRLDQIGQQLDGAVQAVVRERRRSGVEGVE
ncbi:hypothetical protein SAMN06273572_1034 [Monaibacterium marinum]|uniref:Uncharacterized protein n=1 Tax=Pontivivens marinum TaxID=1690039 RepID=A0A2C9CRZ3_9RHOB|nr:hypothetical protein SAMN06273572_1034 [Monaibacterium marinum]